MRCMVDDNSHKENKNRAPQPHVPECNTKTYQDLREETIKRMRALPERIAKFEEVIRALREANTR